MVVTPMVTARKRWLGVDGTLRRGVGAWDTLHGIQVTTICLKFEATRCSPMIYITSREHDHVFANG